MTLHGENLTLVASSEQYFQKGVLKVTNIFVILHYMLNLKELSYRNICLSSQFNPIRCLTNCTRQIPMLEISGHPD